MIYGSVCSGIEAATAAWHPLGWKASFFSEIEKFPRQVLAHHYPETPIHGDFTTIKKDDYETIELLVGGTPCQSFSVAGLRAGLNDPRGNLMLEFGALAERLQPKWLVWENVPGVLSSNGGRDFGSFLAMLGELGYGFSYRILDAQHFGVPQRRRRVFVVGCLGDFGSAAAVLFEQHSLQGHTAPRREKGKEVTGTLTRGFGDSGLDLDQIAGGAYEIKTAKTLITKTRLDSETENFIPTYSLAGNTIGRQPLNGGNGNGYDASGVSYTLTKTDVHAVAVAIPINTMTMMGRPSDDLNPRMGSGIGEDGDPQNTLTKAHCHAVAYSFDSMASNSMKSSNPNSGCNQVSISKTIDTIGLNPSCNQGGNAILQTVAHAFKVRGGCEGGGKGYLGQDEQAFTISTGQDQQLFHKMQVRRLMPIECEILQGFSRNYTDIPGASDSARYKALGNSMAVPVMRWIGERIQMVDDMQKYSDKEF